MHTVNVRLHSHRRIEVNAYLTLSTFLGGDDDNTIGSTATIDTCGCRILEHLDGLDVVRVQLVHTRLGRHTVDDIQRVVVVERTHTTYSHRGSTRGSTVGCDVHARHLALQGFHRVVLLLFLQVFGTDSTNGTRQVRLALSGITRHNHFFQHLVVLLEHDIHTHSCLHTLRHKPHVGDTQYRTRSNGQLEITIKIGDGAIRRSFLQN